MIREWQHRMKKIASSYIDMYVLVMDCYYHGSVSPRSAQLPVRVYQPRVNVLQDVMKRRTWHVNPTVLSNIGQKVSMTWRCY
jgi:hypothetical protein